MRWIYLFLIIPLLNFSCNSSEELNERCELVAVLKGLNEDRFLEQYVISMEGNEITRVEFFNRNNSGGFGPSPDETWIFNYEGGRLKEERRYQEDPDSYFSTTYYFEKDSLFQQFVEIQNGDTVDFEMKDLFFVESPEGVYEFKNSIFYYESGNLVSVGVRDENGEVSHNGSPYRIIDEYIYDDQENLIADPVLIKIAGQGVSPLFVTNSNNIISRDLSGAKYNYTYETDADGRLLRMIENDQKFIEFQYICN